MSIAASAPVVLADAHVRVDPDGSFSVPVRGCGDAVVTVRSARPLGTRWLGGGRPRPVRFGMRRTELPPGRTRTVAFRLSKDHLALLHRMQTVRTTISVTTPAGACRRRIGLYAPAPRRSRHDDRRTASDRLEVPAGLPLAEPVAPGGDVTPPSPTRRFT